MAGHRLLGVYRVGAAQFTMIGLLSGGAVPVLLAATGLGLRHLPMSASLAGVIGPQRLDRRLWLAWVLVDETFRRNLWGVLTLGALAFFLTRALFG